MNHVAEHPTAAGRPSAAATQMLSAGIAVFAAYHLLLAAFMAIAPHAFFTSVGPFGTANSHYIRDLATYNAAIGAVLALALARPSWRLPVLTLCTIQFALHTLNHLLDIGASHPAWNGYFDFGSLAFSTLLLVWLMRTAAAGERRHPSDTRRPR